MGVLFQKGVSGNPNGRPGGSSKKKFTYDVSKILHDLKFNPFEKLAELAQFAKSEKVRCEAAAELASYVAPKLKAVEITTDAENPFHIVMNFNKRSKEAQDE